MKIRKVKLTPHEKLMKIVKALKALNIPPYKERR